MTRSQVLFPADEAPTARATAAANLLLKAAGVLIPFWESR
jgi:hypothetical protein